MTALFELSCVGAKQMQQPPSTPLPHQREQRSCWSDADRQMHFTNYRFSLLVLTPNRGQLYYNALAIWELLTMWFSRHLISKWTSIELCCFCSWAWRNVDRRHITCVFVVFIYCLIQVHMELINVTRALFPNVVYIIYTKYQLSSFWFDARANW